MTTVYVLNNNIELAIRILKRKNQKAGIIKDLLNRKGAMSRGEKRRVKDSNAATRLAKMNRARHG